MHLSSRRKERGIFFPEGNSLGVVLTPGGLSLRQFGEGPRAKEATHLPLPTENPAFQLPPLSEKEAARAAHLSRGNCQTAGAPEPLRISASHETRVRGRGAQTSEKGGPPSALSGISVRLVCSAASEFLDCSKTTGQLESERVRDQSAFRWLLFKMGCPLVSGPFFVLCPAIAPTLSSSSSSVLSVSSWSLRSSFTIFPVMNLWAMRMM